MLFSSLSPHLHGPNRARAEVVMDKASSRVPSPGRSSMVVLRPQHYLLLCLFTLASLEPASVVELIPAPFYRGIIQHNFLPFSGLTTQIAQLSAGVQGGASSLTEEVIPSGELPPQTVGESASQARIASDAGTAQADQHPVSDTDAAQAPIAVDDGLTQAHAALGADAAQAPTTEAEHAPPAVVSVQLPEAVEQTLPAGVEQTPRPGVEQTPEGGVEQTHSLENPSLDETEENDTGADWLFASITEGAVAIINAVPPAHAGVQLAPRVLEVPRTDGPRDNTLYAAFLAVSYFQPQRPAIYSVAALRQLVVDEARLRPPIDNVWEFDEYFGQPPPTDFESWISNVEQGASLTTVTMISLGRVLQTNITIRTNVGDYNLPLPLGGEARPFIILIEIETDRHYHLLLPPELSRYVEPLQYLITMLRAGVYSTIASPRATREREVRATLKGFGLTHDGPPDAESRQEPSPAEPGQGTSSSSVQRAGQARRLLPPAPEVPTPPVPEPVIFRPPIPWDERFKPAHSPTASAVTRATTLIRDFLDASSEPAFLVAETALGPPGDVSMAGYGAEEIAEDIPIAIPFNASCDWKPERQLATYMLSNGSSSAPTYAAVDSLLAESPAPILVEACSTHPFYMITKLAFQPPAPMALVVTSRKGPSGAANSAKAGAAPAAKAKSGSKSKRCPHGSACPNKATTCKLDHSSPAAASGSSRPRPKSQASGARGNSSAPPRVANSAPKGWGANQ